MSDKPSIQPPSLAGLLEIQQIVQAAVVNPAIFADADAISEQALTEIGEILSSTNHAEGVISSKYITEVPLLQEYQYVMPAELVGFDEKFQKHIQSGKDITEFTHAGACLYGPHGNGKSEYVHYIHSVFGDRVDFYQLSISSIRLAENPALELENIYKVLNTKYASTDKYAVIFIDEFDQLFSTKQEGKETLTTSSHSSSKNMSESSTQTSSFVTDTIGTSLFAVFKSILSGAGLSSRTFTCTTTNKEVEDIPKPLVRDARLSALRIPNPFESIPYRKTKLEKEGIYIPRYENLYSYMEHIIDIYISVEKRKKKCNESNIKFLEGVKSEILSQQTQNQAPTIVEAGLFEHEKDENNNKVFLDFEKEVVNNLLGFLGYKLTPECINKNFEIFGGLHIHGLFAKNFPEKHQIESLNRSQIAATYKSLTGEATSQKIKFLLGSLLLPQLEGVEQKKK